MSELSVKVPITHFSGLSHVFTRGKDSLAAVLRALLIQNAQTKIWGASLSSFTDNSGGTQSFPTVANAPALPVNTVTASLGESQSSFTTSLGKIKNATAVVVSTLNNTRKLLGLPLLNYAEGTVASANTIPAQDLTGTGAAVGSTVDWATAQGAANVVEQNLIKLVMGLNEILVAIGEPKVKSSLQAGDGATWPFVNLVTLPSVGTSAAGASSVLVTDTTNWLAAVANAFATIAYVYNQFVPSARTEAPTDSTGGTAASALAADALPTPANGAASTSAPKAGFDTQLGVIRNAISSMAFALNQLNVDIGTLPQYSIVDSTGGTVSSTLSVISSSLTAVDGSGGGGNIAVDQVSALADMAIIDNSLSTLGYYTSKLAGLYNVAPLGTDALGGTVSSTGALAALSATTAAGVSGTTGTPTLLNTAVNTWLAGVKNNISTIAAVLNAMNTIAITSKPLLAIAG
jgi:hypothetical protein